MRSSLISNLILFQKINHSISHPWNYFGDEFVEEIPDSSVVDWILLELRQTQGGHGLQMRIP